MDGFGDLPPQYSELDEAPRHFTIVGSFVYTPSGPRFQLSSTLEQASGTLRIRRLKPKDIQKIGDNSAGPLMFDKDSSMYTIDKMTFNGGVYSIKGARKDTFAGALILEPAKDRVYHQARPNGPEIPMFEAKPSSRPASTGIEWRRADGSLLAAETLQKGRDGVPYAALEFPDVLQTKIRDAVITCWIVRHWKLAESAKPRHIEIGTKVSGHTVLGTIVNSLKGGALAS